MPDVKDLIHETTTGTGTGNLTVSAVDGRVRFSDSTNGFGTGGSDVFFYYVSHRTAPEWERGTGHMSDANTLVRDTVLASTNSNNAVNFTAGTKDVTNDMPASRLNAFDDPASDTAAGIIEIAVQSEMESASSNSLAATPGRLHFHPGVAKVWANVLSTGALNAGYNVSSITDNGAGNHTVNFDTDFSSANYACAVGHNLPGAGNSAFISGWTAKTAGSIRVLTMTTNSSAVTSAFDGTIDLICMGDH